MSLQISIGVRGYHPLLNVTSVRPAADAGAGSEAAEAEGGGTFGLHRVEPQRHTLRSRGACAAQGDIACLKVSWHLTRPVVLQDLLSQLTTLYADGRAPRAFESEEPVLSDSLAKCMPDVIRR